MIVKYNDDGTETTTFQFTDKCGVDLERHDADSDLWTLTFYDDGDPVVLQFVPSWQLDAIAEQYKNKRKQTQ
jgi:hypothetical protein